MTSSTGSARPVRPAGATGPADAAGAPGTDGGRPPVSRRRLLGTAGATGAAGLALGATGGVLGHAAAQPAPPTALSSVGAAAYPFHGRHQPGIVQPVQAHGHLLALDLAPGTDRRATAGLLRRWSRTAAALMAGGTADGAGTGSALDAGPAALTVTFGFGAALFDRLGLTSRRPDALAPLPDFSADALDRRRSGGELWVQIGADDALVAFDALRALQRDGDGVARVRWHMSGFNRTPGAAAGPHTQRNLMGQVDGTNNPKEDDPDFARRVFVPSGGDARHPEWMGGGSYAVVRRIRMLLDDWERRPLAEQERVIGRRKADGAPLSGGTETTPVDLERRGADGRLAVPANAHVRVSAPETNGGAAMLRRSYSYHDGHGPDGSPDAGLLFVAWQADPLTGFVPVQRKLDRGDALSAFVRHEASALFAVPGGAAEGGYVGQALLEG
ncbi:iron uptake transporter deferrochelatase/peroxidase subunit [Streptomyces sp. TRM 70351]|uniref:iron uptake transporter deferrochelatase/peroxidase subunit n=1 Tax=Streptomyces sp. TRM 70351 TaxID=3116552 RepID=UPI002E7B7DE6|nr:iron uptake transporter deferrochelatase/peroxidase subunit [Streptomyces sp. TRM 70351]MEE1929949.1 iron uptake transporter deferrochelatase/peroxidase subunit [Streptomyces sp. TRM 70351]